MQVFGKKVTGGYKIENVTGISQANGFQRTLTQMCQVIKLPGLKKKRVDYHDFNKKVAELIFQQDFNKELTRI